MGESALPQLGRYKVLAELGRGAMGVVYRAEDPLLNRMVAIKTIILSSDPEERAEYEARFHQEARAAGGLSHPNLITIHDIGREADTAYMAMELLEGTELRDMMQQGRVPLALALELAAQVAEGLACAHEHGVVHRDIKPANVMVVRGRQAKIMDFGIARMRVSDVKTRAGAVLGSPKYMSPEQVTGLRADHRSDIFSLGIVLYELASGAPPFSAATVTGLMHNIATAIPQPPSAVDPSLPSMLDLITSKALQKDPDARYQSAVEMAADLRACLAKLGAGASSAAGGGEVAATIVLERTEKTVPVAASQSAEKTVKIAPAQGSVGAIPDAATMVSTEVERTRRSDASGAGTQFGGAVTQLYLSRRADSGEAMKRVEAIAAQGDAGGGAGQSGAGVSDVMRRIWNDPDQRVFALAMALAVACAVLIALSGGWWLAVE